MLRTSSVGATNKDVPQFQPSAQRQRCARFILSAQQQGVTLIEMLIVMSLIALVAGLSYPSITSGLDSLRLRSASDLIVGFLNAALARADGSQQAVEIVISPKEGTIVAHSTDNTFSKRFKMPDSFKIVSVQPRPTNESDDDREPRRFLLYPGGSIPRIAIEIANLQGRKRLVSVDPMTGVPQSQVESK